MARNVLEIKITLTPKQQEIWEEGVKALPPPGLARVQAIKALLEILSNSK